MINLQNCFNNHVFNVAETSLIHLHIIRKDFMIPEAETLREMNLDSVAKTNGLKNGLESIAGLLFLLQIILLFYFNNFVLNILIFGIGWLMLIPSFLFLSLPLSARRKDEAVSDVCSLVEVTLIDKNGVYGIIRHPIHAGWILMSLSLALVSQSWLSILCALIIIPFVMILINYEDRINSIKYGEEYSQYQKEVPLVNIFKGLWRYHKRRENSQEILTHSVRLGKEHV
jgi:protein-S-isoprenylcysteine O-methyltransferase Ste14